MRTLLLAAVAAAGLATPAMAQDAPAGTGFRAEAVAGWDHVGELDNNVEASDGFLYGGAIGYDVAIGGITLGADAELTGSTLKASGAAVPGPGTVGASAGRDIYVGGRIGVPVTPGTTLYAKGGYTNARINYSFNGADAGSDDQDGWRLGAGIEQRLTGGIYAKAEYRYSDYDGLYSATRHQVVAGLGIRF